MFRIFTFTVVAIALTGFVRPNQPTVTVTSCSLENPDTSVSGIILRAENSISRVLGKQIKLPGDATHHFYSKNKEQVLSMTVHAGDGSNLVSIFSVKYIGNYKPKYRVSNINSFETEKGIHLGISKNEVINKLGKCITADSKKGIASIYYRLEKPQDSKTKLLERQNMPIYYAVYYFKKDTLVEFEFGFEYP